MLTTLRLPSILILCICTAQEHIHACTIAYHHAQSTSSLRHLKFLQTRICYYANSCSCFQIELLKCGDVNPNPGPDIEKRVYKYSVSELYNLRSECSDQKVPQSAWKTIKNLHISSCAVSHRARRGGRRKHHDELKIKTIITTRHERRLPCPPGRGNRNRHLIDIPRVDNILSRMSTNFVLWNARSVKTRGKSTVISDFIISQKVHIFALTETWLTNSDRDNHALADFSTTLPNFSFHHSPRLSGKGGGVGVLVHKGLSVTKNQQLVFRSFEYIDLTLKSTQSADLRLVVIYRPPSSGRKAQPVCTFFDELSTLLEILCINHQKLLIAGDFNFHIDDLNNGDAQRFTYQLDAANLRNFVQGPTHKSGHTLDLVITRENDGLVSKVSTDESLPSDHSSVLCSLMYACPPPEKRVIKLRKYSDIDFQQYQHDIEMSQLLVNPPHGCNELADFYNEEMQRIIDHHAPLVEKKFIPRPHAPWYSDALRILKQERRNAERAYNKSGLQIHKDIYQQKCRSYISLLRRTKTTYFLKNINPRDQRGVFKVVKSLSSPVASSHVLPRHDSPHQLADSFGNFFEEKIRKIQRKLDAEGHTDLSIPTPIRSQCIPRLTEFKLVSEDELIKLVKASSSAYCDLDPVPTPLLKKAIHALVPALVKIVNTSLQNGEVPRCMKHSIVKPRLKKDSLPQDELSSYRPIANISFVGKLVERAAVKQIKGYLTEHDLLPETQSAYREHFSVETALLKVQNDILMSLDEREEVVLVLLDFSAAFDTVEHDIFLQRLETDFGFGGTVLKWFASYMKNRTHAVQIEKTMSDTYHDQQGVPQGSVMGPLAFTLYTAPLNDLIKQHGMKAMFYADDTQIYVTFKSTDRDEVVNRLSACIADIRVWAARNKLALNDAKTEVIHCTSKFCQQPSLLGISIGESLLCPAPHARNLGVVFDRHITMKKHIQTLCKSAMAAIRCISKIRHFLSTQVAHILVHSFVTSRIDSCNSLLFGLPNADIHRVQMLQNIAARMITRTPRSQNISQVLHKLHWLPVEKRIIFKLLLLTYKAQHGLAPSYLTDILTHYHPTRHLRSRNQSLLYVPRYRTSYYGKRSFAVAGPTLWNNLPQPIRQTHSFSQFKSLLKTHLFKVV